MLERFRQKLTYANVVATLALFIALGGSAYAIGAGSIGSREVRDNSLRSRDVRKNALTGVDINERTLRTSPRLYLRGGGATVTLGSLAAAHTVDCRPGDTAVFGTQGVGGDQLSFRASGNLRVSSRGRPPTGYTGVVYGEPSATGQRRFLSVTVLCQTKARR